MVQFFPIFFFLVLGVQYCSHKENIWIVDFIVVVDDRIKIEFLENYLDFWKNWKIYEPENNDNIHYCLCSWNGSKEHSKRFKELEMKTV